VKFNVTVEKKFRKCRIPGMKLNSRIINEFQSHRKNKYSNSLKQKRNILLKTFDKSHTKSFSWHNFNFFSFFWIDTFGIQGMHIYIKFLSYGIYPQITCILKNQSVEVEYEVQNLKKHLYFREIRNIHSSQTFILQRSNSYFREVTNIFNSEK
jgi:hypothetical protein